MDLKPKFSNIIRRVTPVIRQAQAAECGLACLAMISGRYGLKLDLPALRRRFDVSIKGMTLQDLIHLARDLGFDVRAVRAELDELSKLQTPCVLHWSFNHFVVLERIRYGKAVILDPAQGQRILAIEEVSRHFTGVALELWPAARFKSGDETSRMRLRDMLGSVVGVRHAMGQVLLFSACLEVFVLLSPIGFQLVIDQAIIGLDQSLLGVVTIGLSVFLLLQVLLSLARSWSILVLQTGLNVQWASGLFDHLTDLPLDFFEKRHTGDIVSRFGSLGTIQSTITTDFIRALLDGAMAVGTCLMMAIYGGWMVFVVLTTTMIYAALRAVIYGPYRRATEDEIVCRASQHSYFLETVRGMASVKSLGLQSRRHATWASFMTDTIDAWLRCQKLDAVFNTANRFLFGADRICLIVFGALAVMNNTLTIGMLIAFLAYRDQFSSRIIALIGMIVRLRMLDVHKDRLADIALAKREPTSSGLRDLPHEVQSDDLPSSSLEMRGVCFRYGAGMPRVLDDCNLRIEAGECVAFTGPSGCGKTTALRILAGLITPESGALIVDGKRLYAESLQSYRRKIACVLQDDNLFAGSIAENIAAFDTQIDWDHLIECTRMSAIDAEIRQMPMGYETLVGDMGSALSGGQKQRLFLARALYQRPRILLLDEATSHLDETNERLINNAVRQLCMTRVMVAHRPSTIALADREIPFGLPVTQSRVKA
ncbi:peptidase domain-containing ABC transporter [uncultured Roseibium sp.]|uniref:peptidase domain-containing ABC transporter n=1 Tax=uncultured Roseibium sp. TaxID=1936171 RepID=UPI0026386ECA|nr:peptidase domain-containing ABC transporter [uncultured Roseibium sp.]